jgi:photosystem I subunit 4
MVQVKKGATVKILRKESYWFNKTGKVVSVDEKPGILFGVTIRFNSVNYNGVNINNFALDEVIDINDVK